MKKQPPTILQKLISWYDEYFLLVLGGFLLAFIPLFPKIPLFSPIEQYIVRARAEDVLVLVAGLVWLGQVIRGKVVWKTPVFFMVLAYGLVGLISILSALFVINTIPLDPLHYGKTLLHFFRYAEYFSLLFIVLASIKKPQHVQALLVVLILTVVGISAYGYGQKYWQWPVYSTMNREFSKGVRLVLTEHARVQSTFAGHYDLGAYLVLTLPVVLAMALLFKNKPVKILAWLAFISGVWLITVSASRTSYFAYFGAANLLILILAAKQSSWLKRLTWFVSRLTVVYLITGLLFIGYGTDMYERFLQVIEGYPEINAQYHALNRQRKDTVNWLVATVLNRDFNNRPQPVVQPVGPLVSTDERPIPYQPSDVYVDVPDLILVESATGSGFVYEERPRVFSDCALQKGLSWCIRVETLWPQAVAGFTTSPLFGTGYATLNKTSVDQFTEAESTDNNFLRTLGETGFLGFATFYGLICFVLYRAARLLWQSDQLSLVLGAGFVAGTMGLLVNAVYIDVFASSKVAFTFWALSGLVLAYTWIIHQKIYVK